MSKPHATPHDPATLPENRGDEVFRSILLPAAAAISLMVLFFTLLLSGPIATPEPATPPPITAQAVAPPAPAAAPPCPVPIASGRAGVVAARFDGTRTSSGERYRAKQAQCMVNAASTLGALSPGTNIRITRDDDATASVVCRVVGTWRDSERTQRLVLVSSALAKQLNMSTRGLIDINTGCADVVPGPTLTADLAAH